MPSKTTIYTMTEYDLLSTAISSGNYYVCTDSRRMYKDISNSSRVALNVTMISTENERLYNTRPNNGTLYYIWETNTLWLYNSAWILQVGNQDTSNGYYYNNNQISPTDDITTVLDNNGLLRDGSVVVRDINRIVKGKIYIDANNNNLAISSYLGGGIQILPNGLMDEMGSLLINPRTYYESVAINKRTGEIFNDKKVLVFDDLDVDMTRVTQSIMSGSGFDVYRKYYTDRGMDVPAKPSTSVVYPISYDDYTIEKNGSQNYYCIWLDNVYVYIKSPVRGVSNGDLSIIYASLKQLGVCPSDIDESNYTQYSNVLLDLANKYLNLSNYEFESIERSQVDGYALYNGEFNTTDEMYVNIRYPLSTNQIKLMDCTDDTDVNTVFNLLKLCEIIDEEAVITSYTNEEIYALMHNFQLNAYTNDPPKYKVWHEGNLIPENIILKPEGIIESLHKLPTPLDLDVDKLDGMDASDFALVDHIHDTADIPDLLNVINGRFNKLLPQSYNTGGILVQYDNVNDKYNFIARPFSITLSGGVTGSGTVTNLGPTVIIPTEVIADNHVHKIVEYDSANRVYVFNSDYEVLKDYILSEDDKKIDKTDASSSPVPNKLLYLDSTGKLPTSITGNAASADEAGKLANGVTIQLSDGVTGEALFDGSQDINIAVTVNSDKHSHDDRYIQLTAIGFDVAPLEQVGTSEPPVYKVPLQYIQDRLRNNLKYMGEFDPINDTIDTETLQQGDYWVIRADGTFDGSTVYVGDWIVYNGSTWNIVNNKRYIESINGYTDQDVNLTFEDVDAIPYEYIDYYNAIISGENFNVYEKYYINQGLPVPAKPSSTVEYPISPREYNIETDGTNEYYCIWLDDVYVYIENPVINDSIPGGKIPITDTGNHIDITSSEAERLSNKFAVLNSDDSDITIIPNGFNVTDGTNDLLLKMKIDESLITPISMRLVRTVRIDMDINGL